MPDRLRKVPALLLAVLVQPMVPAVAAGVAFTADPMTGDRDVVVIDAVRGVGEKLVSGAVTPDRWEVRTEAHRPPAPVSSTPAIDAPTACAVAALARALVTDIGGMLSHPAIIAREYRLPAVVATGDATSR